MLRAKNNDKNGNFTNLYKNNSWQKTINNDDLLASIIKGIEEVKGNDINILDLRDIDTSVCDYFVICNGNSNTQVNAIVNSIQKTVSKIKR
jgi:ribosome-associated protein